MVANRITTCSTEWQIIGTILRGCWIAGFVFLWASVIIIPLGTHLQTRSPHFQEFERALYADIIAANPGRDLGPNMYFMAFAWPFAGCFCVFIALLFTGGFLVIRGLVRWRREAGLFAAGAFVLGCLIGALLGLGEAVGNFRWGFAVLGLGFVLSAAGLGFGAAGAVGSCLIDRYR